MLKGHIDVTNNSKISKERRVQLNQLALQAQDSSVPSSNVDVIGQLQVEQLALMEVFDTLEEVGVFEGFYTHIDRAFKLLIEKDVNNGASIMQTYQDLSNLFRVVEKRSEYIIRKNRELRRVIEDLDILEQETFSQKNGGTPC